MRKGEMTRQRIIEEAAPIFNRRGFQACSIAELMEATGLGKGGIYRHFASKEELAAEAFRYAVGQSVRMRTEAVERLDGSVEKLRFLVRQFMEAPSGVAGGCPLMNTAIDSDDGNEVLRGLAVEGFRSWRERLQRIVKDGLQRGEIKIGTDPARIANVMIATLEGALMMSRLEKTKGPLEDAGEMLGKMLDSIAKG